MAELDQGAHGRGPVEGAGRGVFPWPAAEPDRPATGVRSGKAVEGPAPARIRPTRPPWLENPVYASLAGLSYFCYSSQGCIRAGLHPKLKPRWDVHLSGDDDQLGCAGESLFIRTWTMNRLRSLPPTICVSHLGLGIRQQSAVLQAWTAGR